MNVVYLHHYIIADVVIIDVVGVNSYPVSADVLGKIAEALVIQSDAATQVCISCKTLNIYASIISCFAYHTTYILTGL